MEYDFLTLGVKTLRRRKPGSFWVGMLFAFLLVAALIPGVCGAQALGAAEVVQSTEQTQAGEPAGAGGPEEARGPGPEADGTAAKVAVTVRVKDITRVYGVRDNQLMGYGLVVGLRGTGDSRSTPFTGRTLSNMLDKFNITVDPLEIRSKNVAAVMVTGVLPAFASPGDAVDVTVSSLGDARSLAGGTLLLTELAGADGRIYAVAQGPVQSGADARATVGRVPAGATVERHVAMDLLAPDGSLVLSLLNPDYTTAARIARAVCERFEEGAAVAVDGGTVRVAVPEWLQETPTPFIAEVGELEVSPDAPAKVVLNARTGVVVIGGNVRISPAAVSYNGFSVSVGVSPGSQAQAGGDMVIMPMQPGSTVALEAGATIEALAAALNAVGARPVDIMNIMEALRACGALQAELQIM
ncbi:MAG: flagellar basal body P-ring protein FlgI [Firmicutes bacterium]|nr:flagellar basal body P-ring protein FlgI [Bacillota bacterium]